MASSTFTDGSGNSNAAATQFNWTFDNFAPSIQKITSTYTSPSTIYLDDGPIAIVARFNQVVYVTGNPQITLVTDMASDPDGTTACNYWFGSGTQSIQFRYDVGSGDNSTDLDIASTTALQLNGGTLKDAAGNDADLTCPVPGTLYSLAGQKQYTVDGSQTAP